MVHSWGGEQGLPQNEVRAITQAPDGYLWVGTFGGLARFDGNRFEVFSIANTPGLPNNLINALFCDRLGRLWIGHDTGHVTVFKDHKCSQIPMPADWLRTPIRSFGQDAKGNIWVLNALWKLAIIDDSGKLLPTPQVPPPDYALHFAAAPSDESLRVVTQTGRCYLALPQGLRPDPDQPPVPSDGGRLIRSSLGGYWALSENHLARWLGGQQVEDAGTVRWGEELFGSTCEWKGNIASGTFRNGLYLAGRDGSRIHLDTSSGFPSDRICALFVDKDNVLWVGTGDGGLTG
ncbi:MAG: ligand-binding sensor domain-containing protein, partial [Verrucomicrobiota bacterium]